MFILLSIKCEVKCLDKITKKLHKKCVYSSYKIDLFFYRGIEGYDVYGVTLIKTFIYIPSSALMIGAMAAPPLLTDNRMQLTMTFRG